MKQAAQKYEATWSDQQLFEPPPKCLKMLHLMILSTLSQSKSMPQSESELGLTNQMSRPNKIDISP